MSKKKTKTKKKAKKPEEKLLGKHEDQHSYPAEDLLLSEQRISADSESSDDDRRSRTSSGDSRPGIERPY